MNRLILIGNGFDLAHGLKTKYAEFIEWYWREWGDILRMSHKGEEEDNVCKFTLRKQHYDWFNTLHNKYQFITILTPRNGYEIAEFVRNQPDICEFHVKSPLFNEICHQVETKNWVDIEDVFYFFLKSSDNPKQINDDLEFLKNKLIEYLKSLQEATVNPKIQKQILEHFNKEDVAIGSMNHWYNMIKERINYTDEKWDSIIDGHIINREIPEYDLGHIHRLKQFLISEIERVGVDKVDESVIHKTFFLPDNIMLLDFNYTNTADLYLPKADKFTVNHIHGNLSNPESVIFGYGDERDNEYDALVNKNDNEYLQHIKSFRYLEASNYRDMLSFIESSPYQVCIMGHSCGLSDRTLLATLFEHRNCVSIKPYYHKKDDGTDNYRELVQNIARNFKDPTLMRDRVVRKDRCEPLG
jgi:hypothetical protein